MRNSELFAVGAIHESPVQGLLLEGKLASAVSRKADDE